MGGQHALHDIVITLFRRPSPTRGSDCRGTGMGLPAVMAPDEVMIWLCPSIKPQAQLPSPNIYRCTKHQNFLFM